MIQEAAPQVEQRPLALYEMLAMEHWEGVAAGGMA
jgi:hypothetical protein